jgi:hypothetical protein
MNEVLTASPHNVSSFTTRSLAGVGAAAMLGGAGVVAFFDPTREGIFPVCPLLQLTGLACPGCGLTRGFHALFHGDVAAALDYNALLPMFGFILGYVFVSLLMTAIRGRGLTFKAFHPALLWGFLGLALAFGILRNVPAYPFSILYP